MRWPAEYFGEVVLDDDQVALVGDVLELDRVRLALDALDQVHLLVLRQRELTPHILKSDMSCLHLGHLDKLKESTRMPSSS